MQCAPVVVRKQRLACTQKKKRTTALGCTFSPADLRPCISDAIRNVVSGVWATVVEVGKICTKLRVFVLDKRVQFCYPWDPRVNFAGLVGGLVMYGVFVYDSEGVC